MLTTLVAGVKAALFVVMPASWARQAKLEQSLAKLDVRALEDVGLRAHIDDPANDHVTPDQPVAVRLLGMDWYASASTPTIYGDPR